jgi:hypothetical protein
MNTATIKISLPDGYHDPIELFKDAMDEAWQANRKLRIVIESAKIEYTYES